MKYSNLFGKTVKQAKKEMTTEAMKLLYRGGFVRENVAGRYYYLPLGMRVRNKIVDVIRDEMDKAGAQEMLTPALHPLSLWQETNRNNETGFELMIVKDRRGAEFALGGTAEEMIVDLVRKFQLSYKDLPFNIYQFSSKFRDEIRARGGLLRLREFLMKDAYSFHTDEKDFENEYKNMQQTYTKIFDRLGVSTSVVPADNGYIGGDYCHEFIAQNDTGESIYYVSDDGSYVAHEDVAEFVREDINPNEAEKDLEVVEQPQWVKTMEDNKKHYGLAASHFLKNVVYKDISSGQVYIAVIRGDLEVNKNKLEHTLDLVGQLAEATENDLAKIGTKPGYVHSWGHQDAKYIGDISLKSVKNFNGGQKEDTTDTKNVNYGRDFECEILADIALAKEGHKSPTGTILRKKMGVEVGNIFQLGCHYSSKMVNATYTTENGSDQQYYMGCYGIGIDRTLATIAEFHHDDKGLIWPKGIAPYQLHLVGLNLEDSTVKNFAEQCYKNLTEKGIEVLFDDRVDVVAGVKFADADLIGCPYRAVVSKKTNKKVELKTRTLNKVQLVTLEEIVKTLNP